MKPAKVFVILFLLGAFAAPLPIGAQQAGRVYRIGILSAGSARIGIPLSSVFLEALRERGWAEGRNLRIEWRFAEGKVERLRGFAQALVRLKVDLILAPQESAAFAAREETRTIPIVFDFVPDPVASGLVQSLARPGGNVTGLTSSAGYEFFGKQLELLKEAVPKAVRVAVLGNPALRSPALREEVERAARALGLELKFAGALGPEEINRAFEGVARWRADALLIMTDPVIFPHRRRVTDLAARFRLPAMYASMGYIEAGGLMSYGTDRADLRRRAAAYVDKILKGAKPAELPVEQPTKFELVINLKAAKTLALTIPPSLLARADKVIE